jgi:RNA polymerase sigma-70 factor (ECF subfamily)
MSANRSLRLHTDDRLVAAARSGDSAAMGELLSRHYDRIRAVCCRIAGDTRDGEDATQETLLRIVRNLHAFDQRSSLSTWIYRIATNAALDELRRRQRRPVSVDPSPTVAFEDHSPGLSGQIDPLTSDEIDRIADQMVIQDAIASLGESHRAVVVLRDVAGLNYAEIAETLEIPEGTVKSRLARARAELIQKLRNPEGAAGRPKDTHG